MLVEETIVQTSALSLPGFRDFLRLGTGFADDTLQDGVLEACLRAALAAIEGRTGKVIIERDFSWRLTSWRDERRQPLPVAPVSVVTAVIRIDKDGVETPVDTSQWFLDPDSQRPSLMPDAGILPAVPHLGAVRIAFTAGYGAGFDDLPDDLAQAVMLLAADHYENRLDTRGRAPGIPQRVASLIERYRTVRLLSGGRS